MAYKKMNNPQQFFIVLVCLVVVFSFATGDKDVEDKTEIVGDSSANSTEGHKTGAPAEVNWFNTDFKVCATIAGILTLVAILACVYISKKAKARQDGVNLPKPLVDLYGDY
ncbi:unnamed protein product [Orchesella dallaii]|uniref:Uncharacterized protein n=1 Tax=Orchesella dallaii TaxID=48710 RepID=A0ABP1QNX8_9HEXA